MDDLQQLDRALDRLAGAGFAMGPEWEALHDLCQNHEGSRSFDAAHALCHRIEGDHANAGYWYRRAGRPVVTGSFESEAAALRAEIATP
ncbi:hypothetical protein [Martelella endophytica]|uniref:Uncharacterized protein n=1 Tax=Martelella endophytica TaxID=1486262 RepID=A0A0D5LTW5_MAREN|nr:hypothetical protein [Martelella endophytica]AJY47207.1 hypothetical protein TM49_18460 [Martelella endophytica]